jgi:hypothetical protein
MTGLAVVLSGMSLQALYRNLTLAIRAPSHQQSASHLEPAGLEVSPVVAACGAAAECPGDFICDHRLSKDNYQSNDRRCAAGS